MNAGHRKIGDLIRAYRTQHGKMSQTEFGALCGGVGQTTVSAWERGNIANMRNFELVAGVLGVGIEDFRALMGEATLASGKTQRIPPAVREAIAESPPAPRLAITRDPVVGRRDVPVLGRARGGSDGRFEFNGEVMGWELRPPQLDGVRNGYAIYADGESMFPRYKSGETVWVNPNIPPSRGDDVVVQLKQISDHDLREGFLKEFVSWSGNRLVLRQFNPPSEVSFDREAIESVHLVVFASRR